MDSPEISREQIEFAGLQRVNYSKLPWEEKATILWGWLWRHMLVSLSTGMAIGLFFSLALGLLTMIAGNVNPSILFIFIFILALPLTFVATHPLLNWLFSSRIGDYRILLCKKRENEDITIGEPQERKIVGF